MVQAELNYGEFCSHINFYGEENVVEVLDEIEQLIRHKQTDEALIKVKEYNKHKVKNYAKLAELKKEIKAFKKDHLLWMLDKDLRKEMSSLKRECDKLSEIDLALNISIGAVEEQETNYTDITKQLKQLLAKLGFSCKTATSSNGTYTDSHQEIYQSTYPDEELMQIAEAVLEEVKDEREKRHSELAKVYSSTEQIDTISDLYDMILG